jgi:hypothetical protein
MAQGMEGIIRPFTDRSVSPTRFGLPGSASAPDVNLIITVQGVAKTVAFSYTQTLTQYIGNVSQEADTGFLGST